MSATTVKRVRIFHDNDGCGEGPRDWDNAGKMYCWHDSYNLGDEHGYSCEDFFKELACEVDSSLEEKIERIEYEGDKVWEAVYAGLTGDDKLEVTQARVGCKVYAFIDDLVGKIIEDNYLVLPLSLYDHSGITMSVGYAGPCQFDSGQVGWIICDNDTIEKEFGGDCEKAEKCLRSEVDHG